MRRLIHRNSQCLALQCSPNERKRRENSLGQKRQLKTVSDDSFPQFFDCWHADVTPRGSIEDNLWKTLECFNVFSCFHQGMNQFDSFVYSLFQSTCLLGGDVSAPPCLQLLFLFRGGCVWFVRLRDSSAFTCSTPPASVHLKIRISSNVRHILNAGIDFKSLTFCSLN